MNLKSIIIFLGLSTVYCFSSGGLSHAEEVTDSPDTIASLLDLSIEELMQVKIITASKVAENISNAPGIVSVITAAEIQKFGANSLYEVLNRITGVYLPSGWMYPQNIISLRGDLVNNLDTHTLLLLNGRPFREAMTEGINTSFYLSLPLVAIEKIEVIRGPGSVLYGTGAFTGVINVITKTKFDSDQPTTVQLSATTGALGTRTAEGYVAHQQGKFKWVGSARIFREQGWKFRATDIAGVTDSENYSESNAGVYGYGEYNHWKLNLAWLKDEQESWGEFPVWSWQAPGTENTRILADLGYSHKFSPNWRLDTNLTYNARQTYFSRVFDRTDESNQDLLLELTNYWQKDKLSWLFGGTVYRISGRGIKFQAQPEAYDYVPSYHDLWYTLYTQADYQLSEQTKLIVGGQTVKPGDVEWSFVPRLGMIHSFSDYLSVKVLYSQAYRAASQFEKSVWVPTVVVGNPNLQPETVTTLDLQLLYKTKNYEWALTYFNSNQQHLIIQLPLDSQGAIITYANQAEMRFHGFELEGKLMPIDNLYLVSSLTYQTNKNGAGQARYFLTPTWTAKLGLNYELTPNLSLGLFDSYFSKGHEVNNRFEKPVPRVNPEPKAYHLMTLNLEWKLNQLFQMPKSQSLALNTYLYNVLNEDIYMPEPVLGIINSFPSQQGRGGYIGIKYNY